MSSAPPRRYERSRPGEPIHIDIKNLGRIERGAGHRMIGKGRTAVGFLRRAVRFFERHGVSIEGVLTDNGSAYRRPCTRSPAGRSA